MKLKAFMITSVPQYLRTRDSSDIVFVKDIIEETE